MWANFGPHGPTRGIVGRVGHSVLRRYFCGYIRSAILCGIRVVLGRVGHRWAVGFLELVTMAEPLILLSLQHCNNGCGQWWGLRKKKGIRGSNTLSLRWHFVTTYSNVVGTADTPVTLSLHSVSHPRFAQALTAVTTSPCPTSKQVALRVPWLHYSHLITSCNRKVWRLMI